MPAWRAASQARPLGVNVATGAAASPAGRRARSTRPLLVASSQADRRGHDVRYASMMSA